jgi:hypothetical protein
MGKTGSSFGNFVFLGLRRYSGIRSYGDVNSYLDGEDGLCHLTDYRCSFVAQAAHYVQGMPAAAIPCAERDQSEGLTAGLTLPPKLLIRMLSTAESEGRQPSQGVFHASRFRPFVTSELFFGGILTSPEARG